MALNVSQNTSQTQTNGLEAVFVTNNNKESHEDSFDGVKYVFNPGESVCIPVVAARHMFAYGGDLEQKKRAVARVSKDKFVTHNPETNKSSTEDTMPEGLMWLDNFEFETGEFVPKKAAGKKGKELSGLE
ncbi:MAG: hypothetical protein KC473_03280 [Candidatus Dadabacteria bacterium]|nr:hypothetical protein [Candidatus Dadabacteria bacterium]